MFYFVSKILIGGSMVSIFKGNIGLGRGPAYELHLSSKENTKDFKFFEGGQK